MPRCSDLQLQLLRAVIMAAAPLEGWDNHGGADQHNMQLQGAASQPHGWMQVCGKACVLSTRWLVVVMSGEMVVKLHAGFLCNRTCSVSCMTPHSEHTISLYHMFDSTARHMLPSSLWAVGCMRAGITVCACKTGPSSCASTHTHTALCHQPITDTFDTW